jgi:aspartyl-tRNA(Asn)/glutamyl-tRNA(Gln) amidotransferase subunit B
MSEILKNYQTVVGLEVHAQLSTASKIFCGCSTEFGAPPNLNVCPVCMGHPGVLPVLNEKALEFILKMGLAVNCEINLNTYFARKNYFYPDLPKGYQISQFEKPFCENGYIEIDEKRIRIRRIHLEEDAGKLIHDYGNNSLVDLNRCGIPLIEIVTEPDINSASEAYLFLSKIKQILVYLRICDGNMEEGSLRCDANVSVKPYTADSLGTKTELKNLNSFRNVEKAIDFEVKRQLELIEEGKNITQQTMLWDADTDQVRPMRSKEEAHDYRYFPEPDLVHINLKAVHLENIKKDLPELPDNRKKRFVTEYKLPSYDAEILTNERDIAEYFEAAAVHTNDRKSVSNWIMGDVLGYLKEMKLHINEFPVSPQNLAELINSITSGKISSKMAKEIFQIMINEQKKTAAEIIKEKDLEQISDPDTISAIIDEIISNNRKETDEYLSGKEKVFGFFIGRIMKNTGGKANPVLVNDILKDKLESLKNKQKE